MQHKQTGPAICNFYMDDSGTRNPDHLVQPAKHSRDWFALGGILIDDEDKPTAEQLIQEFRESWPQLGETPFHSHEIRRAQKGFAWLSVSKQTNNLFMTQLTQLLLTLPVVGMACVIDRPGYNLRYERLYGEDRWLLCKTAFAIAVERAVKYATERQRKLRVYVERCSKPTDKMVKGYYETLRRDGAWFNADNSSKYKPADAKLFKECLYDFKLRTKKSSLVQIADLYLWPMCMGGYHRENRPYQLLREAGKLIDTRIPSDSLAQRGIKYSCFERVGR